MLITSEFLTDYQPPDLGADANFFVVARTEGFGEEGGNGGTALGVGWIEDRTRVTDSAVLAVAWALLLTGVADDGSNPLPLARVRAFAADPSEHADAELDALPGERVVRTSGTGRSSVFRVWKMSGIIRDRRPSSRVRAASGWS